MKNILVVNVNWIGDVIFSTPVFKALHQKYPNAHIICMAVPRVVPVLQSCPYVDRVIVYDEKGRHRFPWGKLAIIWELKKFHFDAAFLLHRSWTRAFLVYLAGIRQRIGYDVKDLGRLLTHTVEIPSEDIHRSDYYLNVIESYGVNVSDRSTELIPDDQSRKEIRRSLAVKGVKDDDFLVVVNTGGNWHLKQWSKENFAQLIDTVTEDFNAKVVIPGAVKDIRRAEEIRSLSQTRPIILAGKTELKQTFALMERADVVVSADSGPLHIASSVGTTTIGIFGPTRPEITGPRGKGHSIILQKDLVCNRQACYQLDCRDNQCMKVVSADEVSSEVRKIYQQWREQRKRTI